MGKSVFWIKYFV